MSYLKGDYMQQKCTQFPKRLTDLRETSNLSRQQLADILGVSRASLEYYEKGKRTPDIDVLYRLSEYFNVTADYLIGRTDKSGESTDVNAICEYTGLSEKAVDKLHSRLDDTSIKEVIDIDKVCEIISKATGENKNEVYNTLLREDLDIKSTLMNYSAVYIRRVEDNKKYLRSLSRLIEEEEIIEAIGTMLDKQIDMGDLLKNNEDGTMKIANRAMECYDLVMIAVRIQDFAEKLRGADNGNS